MSFLSAYLVGMVLLSLSCPLCAFHPPRGVRFSHGSCRMSASVGRTRRNEYEDTEVLGALSSSSAGARISLMT
eukprot:12728514-Heterocapsa_arctica.AAC.1